MDAIKKLILSFMMQFIVLVLVEYESRRPPRGIRSTHNSSLQGNAWLLEMLHRSSPVRCRGLLRMQRHVFIRLCDELREKNYLRDSRYVSVYEQVAMFLLTVGHNCRNFLVQDVFQHSGETVSRHFHTVLRAFAAFAKEMIKPPSLDETPSEILRNMKYYPWFKDCIGAIDGTHIPAVVPADQAVPYRSGRKNECTQNVMAVCSFDMRFTWIWPGWEGSAHDFRIFTEATTRPNTNFPHPPQGNHFPSVTSVYLLI